MAWPDKEARRRWYYANREQQCAYQRAYYRKTRQARLAHQREYERRLRELHAADPSAYAAYRAAARLNYALRRQGRLSSPYRPRLMGRIPDWAVKGQRIIDAHSPWLGVNRTPSQQMWLKSRAFEITAWRER